MYASDSTGFAPINGLELYFEIRPLILLHGGIAAGETFEAAIQYFGSERMVVVPHLQGHRHTKDIDRPYRYEHMADNIAQLFTHLDL
ncbi:MAG: hypothetical protein WKF81_07920 [Thermomicrobiales bacterium]